MRSAVYLPPIGSFGSPSDLVDLAALAEEAGWDGLFLWDHVHYEHPVPIADCWVTLGAIAARTSRLTIGPLVTPLPRRRPWKVAREAVTLDHLSNGRLVVGLGLGIDHWQEYSGFAEPASSDRQRADLLDEGIQLLRSLLSARPVDHTGPHFDVHGVTLQPTPVRAAGIPLWTAVLWPASRPGPLVRAAGCDGVFPYTGAPMSPHEAHRVHEAVEARRGVDDPFDLCVWGDPDRGDEYRSAGVTWLIEVGATPEDDLHEVRARIAAGPVA